MLLRLRNRTDPFSRSVARAWFLLFTCSGAIVIGLASLRGDDSPLAPSDPAEEALELADLVLQHHVDPPTRQEMVLAAAKTLYRHAEQPVPATLPQDVSDATTRNSLLQILRRAANDYCDHVPTSALNGERGNPLITDRQRAEESARDVIRRAVLAVIPGEPSITTVASQQVAAQLDSNRYVGIGIRLQPEGDLPLMADVVEGGPAESAGALAGDEIVQIDGHDTQGLPAKDVFSLLRGPEGSIVRLRLQQPGKEARDVTITRSVVPLKTLDRYELHRNRGEPTIGYVYVTRIAASTVHELDQLRSTLNADGVQGLVLDLRGRRQGSLHHTVLLADALLDGGTIGIVRYADRDETCTAQQEDLLSGMPLAVLVDADTGDVSEWLAAALQDNHRALIAGQPTSGVAYANSAFPLADGRHSLQLATAILARGDGWRLLRSDTETVTDLRLPQFPLPPPPGADRAPVAPKQTQPWGVTPDLAPEPVKLNGRVFHASGVDAFHLVNVVQTAVDQLRKQLRDPPTAQE